MLKEAMLYEKLKDGKAHCYLCAHNCVIIPGKFGICGVRQNRDGELYTHVYGEAAAFHVDPIEKKPLYHFLPGSVSYSVAAVGCNFKCSFCQNWEISQAPKINVNVKTFELKPERIVEEALRYGCKSVSYTYTEPTIFFEYAYDTACLAKKKDIRNIFVTNGYMTEQALVKIKPYLDACNVDLKSFSDKFYKNICGGRLQPVLDSIKRMKEAGIWIEITTLIIPGENDSDDELAKISEFIASVGTEIPWHISRFYPNYKYQDGQPTSVETLRTAKKIGEAAGLKYVYIGNAAEGNNTYCHTCKKLLAERSGFDVKAYNIKEGNCPKCGGIIEGVWGI
jgi:pyruvate formate lyase activating enzyme